MQLASLNKFVTQVPIRFSHCDPAGIVYFPQYLVLTNWLVEDWFNKGLKVDFYNLISAYKIGIPIVKLNCEFLKPCRMGDVLDMELNLLKIGRSSITIEICGKIDNVIHFKAQQVLVTVNLVTLGSVAIPEIIRNSLESWTANNIKGE